VPRWRGAMHRAPSGSCHGCAPAASPALPAGSPHRAHRGGDSYCRGVGALGVIVPVWSWLDNICTTLAYGALPCSYPPLMRLRGFPSACRALAEELVPSSRVRETALACSSSIPSVVCWSWRCWLHAARLRSVTTGPREPHAWYISTYRTPSLILSVVPGWLAGASGHRLSSRRGKARTLRHASPLYMRLSEDYSAGVPRLLCHTCAKCWNRAKNGQGGREDVPQS
jgi:hypothetical protein